MKSGDILQFLVDGREFEVAGGSNVTYRLSGFNNEHNPTGTGGMQTKRTRKLGGFDGLPIILDPTKQDLEYLQEIANKGDPVPMSMTLADGTTYSGDLGIEGDLDGSSGEGQIELTTRGPRFEQI